MTAVDMGGPYTVTVAISSSAKKTSGQWVWIARLLVNTPRRPTVTDWGNYSLLGINKKKI